MRILLIGEYSRLHLSLAEGLRELGHEVLVASDGDGFKDYPRDIDLTRKSSGIIDTFSSIFNFNRKFARFTDYDVVQVINPCFTTLNVRFNESFWGKLKGNNKKIFLGAFGDDSYWVRALKENKTFKYSEFFVDGKPTNLKYNEKLEALWLDSPREKANREMAKEADGIAACLYEYYKSYEPYYSGKLRYIPLPVNMNLIAYNPITTVPERVNFFIGINRDRSEYKGTDIMERALLRLAGKYPDEVIATRVESVSYDEYKRLMSEAHVVLDQLYSCSPAMNALLAMAQGKVLVGGGEPEMYDLMGEKVNRPIVNVHPTEEDVFAKLEWLVQNKEQIPALSEQGYSFVAQHHNHVKVAQQYLDFWGKH
ncbi:glycosyltransferase [Dysgonomonas sp. 25]|uniref:glycosyltransferase family protein n=1 Tax=Dysgonomonas sp. 25 TaxID=2302933 RepID=UPI0013D326BA|nr:glycosyltransferase [Dysgonomonas sp. 25]NDV68944.1 glycosyltransferase family 1 protein [Dysgonomonas sp. 25]